MGIFFYISLCIMCISFVQNLNYGEKRKIMKELRSQAKPKQSPANAQDAILYAATPTSKSLSDKPLDVMLLPCKRFDTGDNFIAAMPEKDPDLGRNRHAEERILLSTVNIEKLKKMDPNQYFLYTYNSPCCNIDAPEVEEALTSVTSKNYDNLCKQSCTNQIKKFVVDNKIGFSLGYTLVYAPNVPKTSPRIHEFNFFLSLIRLVSTNMVTVIREDDNDKWFQLRFLRCLKTKITDYEKLFNDPQQAEYLLRKVVNVLTWLCFKTQTKEAMEMVMFQAPMTCFKDKVKEITAQGKREKLENGVEKCSTELNNKNSRKLGPALNTEYGSPENEPSSKIDDYIGDYSFKDVFNDSNM